jgi:gliding motility-associated-like protein
MAYCFVDAFEIALDDEGIAVDEEEVKGSMSKPTTVNLDEDPSWFVPNAFTPNNDGDNDTFVPVWNNVEMKRFEVFSRWGEKVFASTDNTADGWDGTTTSGKDVEPGTYVWQVDLVDADGKTISKSGAITLIR